MCEIASFPPALLHLVVSHQLELPVRQAGSSVCDNNRVVMFVSIMILCSLFYKCALFIINFALKLTL